MTIDVGSDKADLRLHGAVEEAGSFDNFKLFAGSPRIHELENALIEPAAGLKPGAGTLEKAWGGVRDAAGSAFVPAFGVRGGVLAPDDYVGQGHVSFQPNPEAEGLAEEETFDRGVFGGMLYSHFGHCFMESFTRLWALGDADPTAPVFFISEGPLIQWQADYFALLGLSADRIRIVSRPTRVRSLTVAEPYLRLWSHIYLEAHDRQRKIVQHNLARHFESRSVPEIHPRVYISRAKVTLAVTLGEEFIERYMAAQGWRIVYPEQMDVFAQAYLFTHTPEIAAITGSALHQLLFSSHRPTVYYINRFNRVVQDYVMVDSAIRSKAYYFLYTKKTALEPDPSSGPYLLDLANLTRSLESEIPRMQAILLVTERLREQIVIDRQYDGWWYYQQCLLKIGQNDLETAEECIRRATNICDDNVLFVKERVDVYALLGRPQDALFYVEGAITRLGTLSELTDAYMALVEKYGVQQRGAQFFARFEEPDSFHFCYRAGIVCLRGGEQDAARRFASRAEEFEPENLGATIQWINLLGELSMHEEVLNHGGRIFKSYPNAYTLRALILAHCSRKEEKAARALALENLDLLWPESVGFLFQLVYQGFAFGAEIVCALDRLHPDERLVDKLIEGVKENNPRMLPVAERAVYLSRIPSLGAVKKHIGSLLKSQLSVGRSLSIGQGADQQES